MAQCFFGLREEEREGERESAYAETHTLAITLIHSQSSTVANIHAHTRTTFTVNYALVVDTHTYHSSC